MWQIDSKMVRCMMFRQFMPITVEKHGVVKLSGSAHNS